MLPTYNRPKIDASIFPEFEMLTLKGPTERIESIHGQVTLILKLHMESIRESSFLSCAPSITIKKEKNEKNDKESTLKIFGDWQIFNQVFKEYGIKVPFDQVDSVEATKQEEHETPLSPT